LLEPESVVLRVPNNEDEVPARAFEQRALVVARPGSSRGLTILNPGVVQIRLLASPPQSGDKVIDWILL
jgi:hypothetical protein